MEVDFHLESQPKRIQQQPRIISVGECIRVPANLGFLWNVLLFIDNCQRKTVSYAEKYSKSIYV